MSPLRQRLNGTFALRELLQQFEAMGVTQCFRDRGELGEKSVLRTLA
jgi:hypothetical protein